jgi:hypothetical protein
MLEVRQTQVKRRIVHLWSVAAVFVLYFGLPALLHLMAECASTGSGSGCAG